MPKRLPRIIVRRDDNLGDIVIALPVLRSLRANFPRAHITLMVRPAHRPLCTEFSDDWIDPVPLDKFQPVARSYDLAFNIDYFGPGNREKQILRYGEVNHINAVPGRQARPMSEHLLDGLASLELKIVGSKKPQYSVPSNIKADVRKWLKHEELKTDEDLWVGVHIGSRIAEKCWPLERYAKLCSWLYRNLNAQIFLFGSEGERMDIESIQSRLPNKNVHCIVGKPLDFVAGILARMHLFIGNDSGVGHLASAVKVPTVSIFGPSGPAYWRPAGTKSVIVRRTNKKRKDPRPALSLEDVRQGIFLSIQQHLVRNRFPVLDKIHISKNLLFERSREGIIVHAGMLGPDCLVADGWQRVKQILKVVDKLGSYSATLQIFKDATPLIDLFILHGIILQGNGK